MNSTLTPRQIVAELDKFIIGQTDAKKMVAIALRNRWRRQQVSGPMKQEIVPNNIILIGPTGSGKTEISRRLAKLANAPFIKVEATKYTEVGYVGRDVESMIRDLVEVSIKDVREQREKAVVEQARERAMDRVMDVLLPPIQSSGFHTEPDDIQAKHQRTRETMMNQLRNGELDDRTVTIDAPVKAPSMQVVAPLGMEDLGMNLQEMFGNMGPKKTKSKKVSVAEALDIFTEIETDQLLDMDQIVADALLRAENDGIVFLDEIDKIATKSGRQGGDVSREGVQRDLLPIVEGTTVKTKHGAVNTDHILFIASGAFHVSKPSDLIPELQGRFPIRVELEPLSKDDFVQILTEPENALVRQYQAIIEAEGYSVTFDVSAIDEIAELAATVNTRSENIGARRLHTILTKLMEYYMFEIPDFEEKEIRIDRTIVQNCLKTLVADEDLSKFIL